MVVNTNKNRPLIEDYHLLSYDTLDSTNSEARRLAEGGGTHGAMIWARRQESGRGRMGREWVSEVGNLFVSVLLEPGLPFERLPELSFVTALATLETLIPIVGDTKRLRLKWPNDILLDGKKVGGVLVESFETGSNGTARLWAVAGVGVNVETHPGEVAYPAINLKEAGVELVSGKIVLSRFIHHFIQRYDSWIEEGFVPVREAWKSHAFKLGEPITVDTAEERLSGCFADLGEQGHLCLETGQGMRELAAGEVVSGISVGNAG